MRHSRKQRGISLASILFLISSPTTAFYLPGVAPTTYQQGDRVPLTVNHLTPIQSERDSQVHSAIAYDYYLSDFHFCRPENGPQSISESLGSILFGDRIQTSPYELIMNVNQSCKAFKGCGPQRLSKGDATFVNRRIWENYGSNLLVDGLPAARLLYDPDTKSEFYVPGLPIGKLEGQAAVFHNHVDIMIDFHEVSPNQYRVVGVLAEPLSNKNTRDLGNGLAECGEINEDLILSEKEDTDVVYTYSIAWRPSPTTFATRWDKYLHVYDPRIHWFSLVNSAVIVVFLSSMVFVVLVRALRKDITRYNRLDSYVMDDMSGSNGHADLDEGVQEDSGWKLIHGDVFRSPRKPLVLSILAGNGMQLFLMVGLTIAFALMGFLSPSNRGSLGSVTVLLYILFSSVGGFVSSYTYKCLGGEDRWRQNIILTPLALPIIVFGTFFLLNLFLWAKQSSGAVPFTTMLVIIAIWFVISLPLSFAGSYLGFKRPAIQPPVRTNQIPRQIPESSHTTGGPSSGLSAWLARPVPSILLTGILPFGAIFVELYFIMNSLWSGKIYYMFGFLFVCYGLMVVTCATVTVLSVYFLLCAENYHWQWRSFWTSGACSVYVFLNALVFWASRLSFGGWVSGVLYLGYSALISLLVFVLTGEPSILFFFSFLFFLLTPSSASIQARLASSRPGSSSTTSTSPSKSTEENPRGG